MDIVCETDGLSGGQPSILLARYPLSKSFLDDLFQTSKRSAENKEHIGCVDSVHIASLRTSAVRNWASREA